MKFLILLCFIGAAFGAVSVSLRSEHPDFPGQCWIEETKVAIRPGGTYSEIGVCAEFLCHPGLSYNTHTCGSIPTPPGCKLVPDDTLRYPACCPEPVC